MYLCVRRFSQLTEKKTEEKIPGFAVADDVEELVGRRRLRHLLVEVGRLSSFLTETLFHLHKLG